MGSTFEAEFLADALPELLTEFGQVSSVSRGAVTITPTVILDSQMVKTRDRDVMEVSRNWVILLVPVSQYDFGSGIVEPIATDEFTVSSRKYEPRKPKGVGNIWEYSDGTSTVYKIFVEEVAA
jgi:hypothetical protein